MEEHVLFSNVLVSMTKKKFKSRVLYEVTFDDLFPLKTIKKIITLMCNTNYNCLRNKKLCSFIS